MMATFFKAITPRETQLSVDRPTRWMLHAAPADLHHDQTGLLVFRPPSRPRFAVMMADDDTPELIYPPQGHLRSILVLLVASDPHSDLISFLHPLTHLSLKAVEPLNQYRHGTITEDASTSEGRFLLQAVDDIYVRMTVRSCADALETMFAHPALPDGLLDCVRNAPIDIVRQVFGAMLPLMTLPEIGQTATALLADPALLLRLAEAVPEDLWITHGLIELFNHRKRASVEPRSSVLHPTGVFASLFSRKKRPITPPAALPPRSAAPTILPTEFDHLATAGYRGQFVSFGHACNVIARSMVKPTKRACIVAAARNEGLNLLEWIAYHQGLGFENIFLYSNNNDDGSDQLLAALADARIIHWIDNRVGPGGYAQHKAYGHAIGLNADVGDHAWTLIIDLDEFLVLDPGIFGSIGDFIDWQEMREVDAVALNWVMIGSDGDPRRQDALLTHRFRRAVGGANQHVKSMFRTAAFMHSGPHFPHTHERRSFTFRNAAGALHDYDRQTEGLDAPALSLSPDMTYACVFHYFFKSADEFLWKFARNRGDHVMTPGLSMAALDPHFIRSFVGQAQDMSAVHDSRAVRCVPDLRNRVAALMALPGVRDAKAAIVARYQSRMVEVLELFRTASNRLDAGEAGEVLLRFVEGESRAPDVG